MATQALPNQGRSVQSQGFSPGSSLKALLDQLYDIKFSKHTTLVVVMLSMVYAVYRSQHFMSTEFKLGAFIAWATALFIELLVLAGGAFTFATLRQMYVAQLKACDVGRAKFGVGLAFVALGSAFVALAFVALADAWSLTHEYAPTVIMTLAQITQMLFIVGFVSAADMDEREKLRVQYADYQADAQRQKDEQARREQEQREAEARKTASECPHCHTPVAPNNRKRHIASCSLNPDK